MVCASVSPTSASRIGPGSASGCPPSQMPSTSNTGARGWGRGGGRESPPAKFPSTNNTGGSSGGAVGRGERWGGGPIYTRVEASRSAAKNPPQRQARAGRGHADGGEHEHERQHRE